MMMSSFALATTLAAAIPTLVPTLVGAFGAGCGSLAPLHRSPPHGGSALRMSSPGGWENDDFLDSLGGGGGSDPDNVEGYGDGGGEGMGNVERIVPPNDMTDEEITMMAMRAAQFYNTDTSVEEAYGTPKQGPPRKQEEEEDFQ